MFMVAPPFRCGYFNSQPHKEADNPAPQGYGTDVVFQLTASQGG